KMMRKIFDDIKSRNISKKLNAIPANDLSLLSSETQFWDWEVNPGKEVGGITISLVDVTEQTKCKKNFETEIKNHREFIDRNVSALYRRTLEGEIIFCNQKFADLLNVDDHSRLIGKNIHDLLSIYKNFSITAFSELIDGNLITKETELFFPDGTKKWVIEHTKLIQTSNSSPRYIEGTAIEITELKNAQNELIQSKNENLHMQSKALSSQMNPHFIFNSINSINNYIVHEKWRDALEFTSDFSKLIRSVLANSRNESIGLSKEIQFLTDYVNLERHRLNLNFDFEIDCSNLDKISDLKIPPMIIQPFVENAILHALDKKDKGVLIVYFGALGNDIAVVIQDNGPGIVDEFQKSDSLGIKITNARLDIYNSIYETNVFMAEIENITNKDEILGLEVTLRIPNLAKYAKYAKESSNNN
ncbi:MAG: PAS domain S-box-containing protein, partial [Arenicella sp.]